MLHLRRTFALLELIIGILKSGAGFAVVDQRDSIDSKRTRSAIGVAKPDVLITDNHGIIQLVEKGSSTVTVTIVNINEISLGDMPIDNPPDETQGTGSDLAHVVFTSGSTGAIFCLLPAE